MFPIFIQETTADVNLQLFDTYCQILSRAFKRIHIIINEKNESFVFTIENKIWSQEHDSQLEKYQKIIDNEFSKNCNKYFIYLTPDSNINNNLNLPWKPLYYSHIADILKQTIDYHNGIISHQIMNVIIDYYTIINRNILMADKNIAELCKIIWQNHREALNTLINHKPDLISDFANLFIEKLYVNGLNPKKNIEFKTKEFERLSSDIYLGYYILKDINRLKIQIYIQKRNNEQLANKVIQSFTQINNPNIRKNLKLTDGSSGNMIYSKDLIVVDNPLKFINEVEVSTKELFDSNCNEFFLEMEMFDNSIKNIQL